MPDVETKVPADAESWKCGCRTWRRGDVFYIAPCDPLRPCSVQDAVAHETAVRGNQTVIARRTF